MHRLIATAILAAIINSLLGCAAMRQWNEKIAGGPQVQAPAAPTRQKRVEQKRVCPPEKPCECEVEKGRHLTTIDLNNIAVARTAGGKQCWVNGKGGQSIALPCVINTYDEWISPPANAQPPPPAPTRGWVTSERVRELARATKAHPPDVLVLGSSTVNDNFGMSLIREMNRRKHHVHKYGKPSSGLRNPEFYDWVEKVQELPEVVNGGHDLKYVFVFLGTNDTLDLCLKWRGKKCTNYVLRGTPQWRRAYSKRVKAMTQHLCDAGVQHVVWLTPPAVSRGNKRMRKWLPKIRRLQLAAVNSTSCGTPIDLGPLDDVDARPELRKSDGVHITKKGARRLLRYVLTNLPAVR